MSDKQSRDISEKYSPEWFYDISLAEPKNKTT